MTPAYKRFQYRKRNRERPAWRKHLRDRNWHHLTPQSRMGDDSKQNMLLIDIEKHAAWHKLWGTKTAEEVLDLLTRVVRAKRNQS